MLFEAALGAANFIGNMMTGDRARKDELRQNEMNMQLQRDTLDWQKGAQMYTWSREDNAIQRRVKDMRAAGINPVLAAGNPAQSSTPLTPITPRSSVDYLGLARNEISAREIAMMMFKQQMDVSKTIAETEMMRINNARAKRDLEWENMMYREGYDINPFMALQGRLGKEAQDYYVGRNNAEISSIERDIVRKYGDKRAAQELRAQELNNIGADIDNRLRQIDLDWATFDKVSGAVLGAIGGYTKVRGGRGMNINNYSFPTIKK